MSAEELYYACCARIDDDTRVAEEFLIGCVHELTIRLDEKVERDMIRANFQSFYIDKYTREMNLILNMKEDSLASLIASSLDLSLIYKQVNIIYDKIDLSDIKETTANCHAHKAERISKKMKMIAGKMVKIRRKQREEKERLF